MEPPSQLTTATRLTQIQTQTKRGVTVTVTVFGSQLIPWPAFQGVTDENLIHAFFYFGLCLVLDQAASGLGLFFTPVRAGRITSLLCIRMCGDVFLFAKI